MLFSSNFGWLKQEENLWIKISCYIPNVVSIYITKFTDESRKSFTTTKIQHQYHVWNIYLSSITYN